MALEVMSGNEEMMSAGEVSGVVSQYEVDMAGVGAFLPPEPTDSLYEMKQLRFPLRRETSRYELREMCFPPLDLASVYELKDLRFPILRVPSAYCLRELQFPTLQTSSEYELRHLNELQWEEDTKTAVLLEEPPNSEYCPTPQERVDSS